MCFCSIFTLTPTAKLSKTSFTRMAEKLGLPETVTLHRGAEDAYDFVVDLMGRLSIDCYLAHRGRLLPVWNQAQYDETAA